jgi:pyridoxal biosynthesis lyase PdxS
VRLRPADVVNAEQARIAEQAGAVAVMALERIPADIRRDGGVARMSDPSLIQEIKDAVTIPVMAKVRGGRGEGGREGMRWRLGHEEKARNNAVDRDS